MGERKGVCPITSYHHIPGSAIAELHMLQRERQPVATVGGDQIGVLRLVPPPMSKVEETRVRVLQGGCTHAPTAYTYFKCRLCWLSHETATISFQRCSTFILHCVSEVLLLILGKQNY